MSTILYSFRRCPYAIRARMALKYSGVKVSIDEVSLKNKPQSLLQISPKGQVPVLVMKDKIIDESKDIMLFALSVNDPDGWLRDDLEKINKIEALILSNDTSFKKHLDHYKYCDNNQPEMLQNYRLQGEAFLQRLEYQLQQNGYLCDDRISYGDIAIFPFIRQFAHVDKAWFDQLPYPKLQQWLASFLDSKLFEAIMMKDLKEM